MDKIEKLYRTVKLYNKINKCYKINRPITEVFPANCWANEKVFIIGGGESIKDLNFSLLDNYLSIGINKTFEHYPNININYSNDIGFYDKIITGSLDSYAGFNVKQKWDAFKGMRLMATPFVLKKFENNVHVVKKCVNKVLCSNIEDGSYAGSNSGTGALMLAATLGAKEIYLLGYDFTVTNRTHWHEGYANRDVNYFKGRLERYAAEIASLAPLLTNKGVKVYNLNKDSALRCFEFKTIEEVLKRKIYNDNGNK